MVKIPSFLPSLGYNGLILVNKPAGVTSHDVVQKARKIFQTNKIGHSGTLDPFSQGLLLLLVGEVVSLQQFFTTHSKVYRSRFRFGITTDTLDPTGKVIKKDPLFLMPSRKKIQDTIASKFIGKIQQIPPSFSAIKIGGQRSHTLARKGKEFALPPRPIEINRFEILSLVDQEIEVEIACSSGTYIRSLARDLAQSLATVGMVESLVREKVGDYSLEEAIDIYPWGSEKKNGDTFEMLHQTYPGILPMKVMIDREKFLKGIRIQCSWEEFFKAKNGNFTFSLLKRQDGLFHLVHKDTVMMIVEKKYDKVRVIFNLLKYLDL